METDQGVAGIPCEICSTDGNPSSARATATTVLAPVGGENWRLRLPWTLGQIENDPALRLAGVKLCGLIRATRRCRP